MSHHQSYDPFRDAAASEGENPLAFVARDAVGRLIPFHLLHLLPPRKYLSIPNFLYDSITFLASFSSPGTGEWMAAALAWKASAAQPYTGALLSE